jgi:hypothetical protein
MSTLSTRYVTQHFVSLNKFDASMDRVMAHMWASLGLCATQKMFPTLIGVDVDSVDRNVNTPALRTFFKKFRGLGQKHFVRFMTDTLWAMESDNGDVFYSYDGPKQDRCDVVWTLKSVNDHQVEITAEVTSTPEQRKYLSDLSHSMKRLIPSKHHSPDLRYVTDLVSDFYKSTKHIDAAHQLEEDLHVLLIPNLPRTGFYPIILHGMSHFDAKRKGRQIIREFDHHLNTRYEILTHDVEIGDMFYRLLDLIQATDKFGMNVKHAQDTYALAEALFGIFALNSRCDESNHDVVLFHHVKDSTIHIDTYRYDMGYMHQIL